MPSVNNVVVLSLKLTFVNDAPLPINKDARVVPLTSNVYCGIVVLIPIFPPLIILKTKLLSATIVMTSCCPICLINNAGPLEELINCNLSVLYVVVLTDVKAFNTVKFDVVKFCVTVKLPL